MQKKTKQLISFMLSLFLVAIGGFFISPSFAYADETAPSIISIASDGTSSQAIGSTIKWTAQTSGTVSSYQWDIYRDSVKIGETLSTADNYISYTPTLPGKYKVVLSIKDSTGSIVKDANGNPITMESAETQFTSTLKINSITVDKSGTIMLGTSLRWTASAQGSGLQYSWSVFKSGVSQAVYTKGYNNTNYVDFTPKEVGTYYAVVTVKDSYSQTAKLQSVNSTIAVSPLKITYVKADKSGRLKQGTSITYTVGAQGTGRTYSFKVYRNSQLVTSFPYSTRNYLKYTPEMDGNYKVLVTVRDIQGKTVSAYSSTVTIYVDVNSLVTSGAVYGTIRGTTTVYSSMSKSRKVTTLKSGTKVEVIQDRGGKWYNIRSGNITGWITSGSLYIPPDPSTNTHRMTTAQIEQYVNTKSFTSGSKYFIWVDLNRQLAHVFTGSNHHWKLVRSMATASGKNKTPTTRGQFTISARGPWFLSDNPQVGAKYWVRFNGDYMFHSILYYTNGNVASAVTGRRASHGCIRLGINDITWVYKNMPNGTKVFIN